ncbi:hypothetical protein [Fluviicola taffensis]|uniref:hypothetical protein n=1 Tax=Fluviicola taffensis TaxID=191579 RepID=UPI0031384409
MNSIFLRAKHWQLFIPLIAIPFVTLLVFGFAVAMILLGHNRNPRGPEEAVWIFYFFPLIFALCGFIQFAWFWNVITKLNALVPTRRGKFPMGRIKLFFFIPIIYFCVFPFFIAFAVKTTAISDPSANQMLQLGLLGILVFILHFLSIFCILHTIYFAAKTIRSAELKINARFSSFVGYFFLIWIFPVGIWFIQPRINALLDKANRSSSSMSEELLD